MGIKQVIVNGVPVIDASRLTGGRPGRVLRGPARPEAVQATSAYRRPER